MPSSGHAQFELTDRLDYGIYILTVDDVTGQPCIRTSEQRTQRQRQNQVDYP